MLQRVDFAALLRVPSIPGASSHPLYPARQKVDELTTKEVLYPALINKRQPDFGYIIRTNSTRTHNEK
jgi:hypothetical protein